MFILAAYSNRSFKGKFCARNVNAHVNRGKRYPATPFKFAFTVGAVALILGYMI